MALIVAASFALVLVCEIGGASAVTVAMIDAVINLGWGGLVLDLMCKAGGASTVAAVGLVLADTSLVLAAVGLTLTTTGLVLTVGILGKWLSPVCNLLLRNGLA